MSIGKSNALVLLAILCSLLAVSSCRKKHKHSPQVPPAPQPSQASARNPPPAVPVGYSEEGMASWYGIPYHGRHAADGEVYDMETLVAAHRVLPFNTWIKVTNLANHKEA